MSKEIIAEAHSWLGTRFKHQGRVKKNHYDLGGCDCLGLIIGVAASLNLKALNAVPLKLFDQNTYPKLLTSNILLEQLDQLLRRVEIDFMQPGDVILLKINNWPQHLAITVSVDPEIVIIHSYIQARRVVKQHLPKLWFEKIAAVYRLNSSA